jgi:hypothetical protein
MLSRTQGHNAAGRIRWIEKSSDLIGFRSRDLPGCSVVPQPTTLPSAPPWPAIIQFKHFKFVYKVEDEDKQAIGKHQAELRLCLVSCLLQKVLSFATLVSFHEITECRIPDEINILELNLYTHTQHETSTTGWKANTGESFSLDAVVTFLLIAKTYKNVHLAFKLKDPTKGQSFHM